MHFINVCTFIYLFACFSTVFNRLFSLSFVVPSSLTHFLSEVHSPHANGQLPPTPLPPCLSNQKSIKNTSPPSLQSQALVEGGIETIPAPLPLPFTISRLSYLLPFPPSSTYGLPISPPKLRPPVYWKLAT